jgi:D-alanyl-D-alanine carboxypeptidase
MNEIEKKDPITLPLFIFNISLLGIVIGLICMIYTVDVEHPNVQDAPVAHASFIAPVLSAQSAIVWDIIDQKVIFEKDAYTPRSLASLTKIMSAVVARKLVPKNTQVSIRKEFLVEDGDAGLHVGEQFSLSKLIDFSLIVSSNDGARSIASVVGASLLNTNNFNIGRNEFLKQMNKTGKTIGKGSFVFSNETGLDNANGSAGGSSSAYDMAHLFEYAMKYYPDILEATRNQKQEIVSNEFIHEAVNTNRSLGSIPNVLASKTGTTLSAGGNLGVVFDAGFNRPIVVVVLGSTLNGRFTDVVALASSTLEYIKQHNTK